MSRFSRARAFGGYPLGLAGAMGAIVLALVGTGCATPEPPPPPKPRNVVVILLDTLRADHLGAYGYHRPTSPYFDQLASRGVLFEQATSAAPATFPSVNSLFTSRLPDLFFDTSSEDLGIPEELTTLAEAYGAAGYRTAAVSASPVVRASPSFFNPAGGFGQGFETFDESCGYSERHVPSYTAPCVTDQAVATLDALGEEPFFFYIHYLDPHDPYQPPEDGVIFHTAGDYQRIPSVAEGRTYPITRSILGRGETIDFGPEDIQHLVDLYDGEIRAVDSEIERLMGAFEERGLAEDTLFVFVSDHGESFLEHENVLQHGRSVYQSELHVVLMFYWPQGLEPQRRREPVCSVDVMPTLMELSGLDVPEGSQGVALLGLDGRPRRGRGSCVAAGRPDWRARQADLLALRMGSDKVIYRRSADHWEMYDLAEDADETQNLLGDEGDPPERFDALRQTADAWIRAIAASDSDEGPIELDPEVEKALRALGYIQ